MSEQITTYPCAGAHAFAHIAEVLATIPETNPMSGPGKRCKPAPSKADAARPTAEVNDSQGKPNV